MIMTSILLLASATSAFLPVPASAGAMAASMLAAERQVSGPPAPLRWRRHRQLSVAPVAHRRQPAPLLAVAAARRAATRDPDPNFAIGAAQVYPWSEGALYRLYAAPGKVSDMALQPGETLVSVAADTVRWVIGDTASGSGTEKRTHILVKPAAPGLATNLVIATDRRIYHVEALSTVATAMAEMSWTYPSDALVAIRNAVVEPESAVAPAIAVENLEFGYRIEGDNVAWRPLRAFDDGHQTFIEFPTSLGDGEAPPLFITGADGKAELVNYRVKGHYYVVDRLFAAAELRLGGKHQQVVRIIRDAGSRRPRRAA